MSGMKSMRNRHFVRRVLLTAAITATAAHEASPALGFENGIVQTTFQPGQPVPQVPQGNSTVTQELNRMFEESGQPMPSMVEQNLPNANVPIQGKVQPHMAAATHSSPSSPGFMSRFFGKLRGNSSNANVQPPVPPDYKPSTPRASTTASANGTKYQSAPPHSQQVPQPPQGRMAQSQNLNHQNANNSKQSNQPGQNVSKSVSPPGYYGNGQTATPSVQNQAQLRDGAATPISPRSGASVQSANMTPASHGANAANPAYTQPGSAPGFMAGGRGAAVIQQQPAAAPPSLDNFRDDFVNENHPNPLSSTATNSAPAPVLGAAARNANDGFDSPFQETTEPGNPSEVLDLDSLIEIPPARQKNVEPAANTKTAEALGSRSAEATFAPATKETTPAAEVTPEENPFTGVQLDGTDAKFFGGQLALPADDAETRVVPPVPMEDFDQNLPAFALPPIDELNTGEATATDGLGKTPQRESVQPSNTVGRAELTPKLDVPVTTNAAENEHLRQTSEQERRLNQLQQIQSRVGQTGFKGFCPVALRDRRQLIEADPMFESTFGLQTYTFSSAEAKAAFDNDPSRFAPAAGGSDVVVLVNSGEEQAGLLDYALWHRDRLYMFRSRETMSLFSKDPQRFASQY